MDSESRDCVLSIKCLQTLLNEVWSANSEWYNIGLGLGLSIDELKSIDLIERRPGHCLREVLIKWLEKLDPKISQLIEALRQPCVGHEQLAENLRTWAPPARDTHQNTDNMAMQASVSTAASASDGAANYISGERVRSMELSNDELQNLEYRIVKDVTQIHEKFATLQTQIRDSLSSKVPAKKVAAHVIAYGVLNQTNDEKLKFLKHDSLEEVFSILSNHWSFLDYDLLKSIVKIYGSEDEESKIEEYQKELQFFCKRRVSEVPKGFIQKEKSENDMHDRMIIKLKLDHPRLRDIKDLKIKLCDVMGIEPATLQIEDVQQGCVEVIFLVSKHISHIFKRPLTKQQWEAFQAASVVSLSYGPVQVKPNFEAIIAYIGKELDHDKELLDKLISVSSKQKFKRELIPSGKDFLMKVQENGWISPDNPNHLYDLLERVNRHDIVHKAKLEALVHGYVTKFEEENEKEGQSKEFILETKAARLKKEGFKDKDIIKAYMKELKEKKDDYFEQITDTQLSKGESSNNESDDDEIDSDYQSQLASVIDDQDEAALTEENELESQCQGIPSDIKLNKDVSPNECSALSLQFQNPSPVEGQKWEVECTSQVLKKLRHKKAPLYLRKAVCKTVINDLACSRHWVPVKTNDTEHHLYQRKILRNRVTILWERAIQFSPNLTKLNETQDSKSNAAYFVDVIRLWDIVLHERSCQNRIKAIEKAWNREKGAKLVNQRLKLCNPNSDQSLNQVRIFKCVLSDSENFDFQVLPPTDPDPNQCKPATLYTVPHNIECLVSTNQKFELPITMWPEEHKIINEETTEPMLVLGRSGTGKTTCCLYRMVQEFLDHHKQHSVTAAGHPLRQLFVTKNKLLCEKFEVQFRKLIAYHTFDEHIVHTQDIGNLENLLCPVFLTWDEFLILMDHSLGDSIMPLADTDSVEDNQVHISKQIDSDSCLIATGTKVTADYFIKCIWKKIKGKNKTLDPELVWMEIKSFIKGYKPSSELPLHEYVNLSPKIAPNFAESRQVIYEIYQQYVRHCETMKRVKNIKLYDECDLVFQLYQKLSNIKHHESGVEILFDSLYVDEVQDFTQCEVLLLIQSCKTTDRMFLTGDTAQTVMRDVSFRFKDMKTSFFKEITGKAPLTHKLTINYRSHSGILNLAQHVLRILEEHYPHSVDEVLSNNGMFPGPTPKFIKPCNPDMLKLIIAANVRDPSSETSFGYHQAVIVRTESDIEKLPFDRNDIQMFSIYEAKGLEYDDVLLYDFFTGCAETKQIWKEAFSELICTKSKTSHSILLNIELKQLYTAITRAKVNLWIYESKPFDEHSLPILRKWREGMSNAPLIEVIDPNNPNFKFEKSFATAKTSTPKQWKSQGDFLLKNKRWKQAAMCYRKAHRFDLEAEALLANPHLSRPKYHEIVIAYLQADEVTHNAAHLVKVADYLRHVAKNPDDFLDTAWLYKSLKMKLHAIEAYKEGGHHMKASELHEEYGEYPDAVQVLVDAKLYLDAAIKAKKFEDCNSHTSFEHSSDNIAKEHILKYCQPPEKINTTVRRMFYGLLKHIKDSEYQVVLLKHSKRFSEAFEKHHCSHNYAKYYRLAFAQGPNIVAKKSASPNAFSDTYYDSALQLSLMQGHDQVNSALVIHSGRAYFSVHSPYIVLKVTQLENLSKTSRDVLVRINALLLLARFDASRINEAVEICHQQEYLPGEVELITYYLHIKKLPINCSFRNQLDIAKKIQYLLSLERDVLNAQYKGLLGLYEGKNDELYLKQKDYLAELKCTFEPDCYLLPHESQDIWLQEPHRLSQGKRIRDIDGMYILSPDILFRKITGHLKGRLRLVEISLAACVSQSPLYKYYFSQRKYYFSSAQFDTEAAHLYLEFCMFVLLNKVQFHKSTAMELLRSYHSIETSHFFPICENYTSHIDIIRGDAWRTFQSLMRAWMNKCISNHEKFDFLKLWEQSAIAKNIPILRKNLDHNKDDVALHKATLMWIDICQHVVSNPLDSCHTFFFKCVPQLIKLKQNLNSIIDAMSICGTITLILISQCSGSPSSLIIPHMYARALSVYESLISKPHSITISSACYSLANRALLKDAMKVLQQALKQLVSLLTRKAAADRPGPDNLRQYLILTLTLFVNIILLQPASSAISKFHLQLNEGLELIQKRIPKWKFQFDCQMVCIGIQQASCTLDFLQIIEYLLCPSTSSGRYVASPCREGPRDMASRYEALMTIVRGRRGLEMNILSDREVRNLPSVTILGFESIPRLIPTPKLLPSPLVPESERRKKLYFQFHFQDKPYSLGKIASNTCQPQWMKIPENPQLTLQPPITGDGSPCYICKIDFQGKDEHMKSGNHAKNLALYRKFSVLHDTKYTHCASKLGQLMPRLNEKAKEIINLILKNNDTLIQSIYKEGQWENGIDLLLTYCIPNVENTIESLTHFPAVNLIIIARARTLGQ